MMLMTTTGVKITLALIAFITLAAAWQNEKFLSGVLFVCFLGALIFISGCAQSRLVAEVKTGVNVATQGGFAGGRETFKGSLHLEWGERYQYGCELTDISHVSRGAPFNNKHEDYIHFVGCGVRFQLWSR